jgi:glycosyltransferase involved in cell wall biosynthesis
VDERKVDVIFNWCNEAALAAPSLATDQTSCDDGKQFHIVFAGNMGKAQALDAVLNAARLLGMRAPQIRFTLVGRGVDTERLKQIASDSEIRNVTFMPQVPMEQVASILQSADALLVHLKKDPLFEITIPSKTQAYLAAGRPILMAVRGDAAALVTESGAGVVAEPENPDAIADAAMALLGLDVRSREEMGRAGAKFYGECLSMQVGVTKFARIFNRLCRARTPT